MANSNTSPTPAPLLPPSTTTVSVKLDGSHNYLAWKMQFLNLLRSTTPAAGTPLIIPSSVVSSPLLSNISATLASQDNHSFSSTEISNLAATNSAHSSSATTSNYSSPPSPILNSKNPTNVDIVTSSISPSPDPDNTSPTDLDIDTSSISPSPDPDNASLTPIV